MNEHTTHDPEPFLTQKQRARRHHISERTAERQRQDGSGPPYVKIGRRVLYRITDLEAWEAERTFSSTSQADQVSD